MPAITLEQLLAARDARSEKERLLCREYPACALVVLTVVLPGSEKRNAQSLLVARAACEAAERALEGLVAHRETCDLETGYEGYWLVRGAHAEVKRRLVEVEENHPLGRLFDLDVVAPDGTPLSRQSVGRPPRRCLLCGQEARYCMRNKTHSYEEILRRIRQMTTDYEHGNA